MSKFGIQNALLLLCCRFRRLDHPGQIRVGDVKDLSMLLMQHALESQELPQNLKQMDEATNL